MDIRLTVKIEDENRIEVARRLIRLAENILIEREDLSLSGYSCGGGMTEWKFEDAT